MWQNQDLNTFWCQTCALTLRCHLPETGTSHAFFLPLNYGEKKASWGKNYYSKCSDKEFKVQNPYVTPPWPHS